MNITVLDLETYYDQSYSLKKQTIPEYVHDPRFHVHGLAIAWPDGRRELVTDVASAITKLRSEFGQDLERTTVVCHHAQFDLYVLAHRFGVHPRYFIDTMLLAHAVHVRREGAEHSGVSLEALAERYNLPRKGNLDFMCGVRQPNVQQMADLATYARRDVEITAALAEHLLPQITRPEVELPILMHTVRLFTERGVPVDVSGIDAIEKEVREQTQGLLNAAGVTPSQLTKPTIFVPLLESALARTGRKVPMKPGKSSLIPAIAKTDREMQAMLEDDDPVVAALASARLEKKGEDQKLARLATLRRIAMATGGVLPPYLVYYGGHTGRFSGGGGFNVQNQGRSGLGARIRQLLMARPGHTLVIGDLAQIEARITAWLAGQDDMLDAFRNHQDLYSEFASTTLHRDVHKPTDDDPSDVRAQLSSYREVGKQAVLGLGFGMAALTFMNTLRAKPAAASLFDTGELTPIICRNIVDEFRQRYPAIPRFWSDLETAAESSIEGVETVRDKLRVDRDQDVSRIWLPSGRALRYANLRLENRERTIKYLDEFGQESEFTPEGPSLVYGCGTTLYGGKLCENVVQAVARDILVEAILRLEARGFKVCFHVHDEIVLEVPEEQGDTAKAAMVEELTRVPEWAGGLPIACEVSISQRYRKG